MQKKTNYYYQKLSLFLRDSNPSNISQVTLCCSYSHSSCIILLLASTTQISVMSSSFCDLLRRHNSVNDALVVISSTGAGTNVSDLQIPKQ